MEEVLKAGCGMRIALIADVFPPLRSSGAVQLRDLAREFVRQGHRPTVMIPACDTDEPWAVEDMDGVEVVRLRAPRTKDVGYLQRTVGEFLLPFAMLRNLRRSPLRDRKWDGVVWYSPTIFLGPMANALKQASGVRSYLIIRDIFPEWAVNMGLLSRWGLPHFCFKLVERYQYSVADTIGVQTPANMHGFAKWAMQEGRSLEVLQNWLAPAREHGCSISVAQGPLRGRFVFVYAGNMGVAQGMDILIDLAAQLCDRADIGFLFVGRGSHAENLRSECQLRQLDNVQFHDEIDPLEIPALYAQCHAGIVALDLRHKTHNIPGKFLTYMQSGLPVLACVNPGNDLVGMIETNRVGRVTTDHAVATLKAKAEALVHDLLHDPDIRRRCIAVSDEHFSPEVAVRQITWALQQT